MLHTPTRSQAGSYIEKEMWLYRAEALCYQITEEYVIMLIKLLRK